MSQPSTNTTLKKVRWGVLSTAKIGLEKVIPAMQQSAWCDMHAIASRSLPKTHAAARAGNLSSCWSRRIDAPHRLV